MTFFIYQIFQGFYMRFRNFCLCLTVFFATLLVVSAPVRASVVVNSLFPAPEINQLTDDSLEVVYKSDGTTPSSLIAKDDILRGQITYHAIQKSGNTGSAIPLDNSGMQVTAVFSAKVLDIHDSGVPSATRYTIVLGPESSFETRYGTGAMAALWENDAAAPYNTRTAGTFADYFSDAQTGTLLATVGFTGAGGAAQGGEGWTSGVATLSTVPGTNQAAIGEFTANVNLVGTSVSEGVLNDIASFLVYHSQTSFYGTGADTQVLISGKLFTRASGNVSPNDGSGNPFPVFDNSSTFFQVTNLAVPEPGSMLVWAGMSLAGACAAYRRRRKVAG